MRNKKYYSLVETILKIAKWIFLFFGSSWLLAGLIIYYGTDYDERSNPLNILFLGIFTLFLAFILHIRSKKTDSIQNIKKSSSNDEESWFQFEWENFFNNLIIGVIVPPIALFAFFSMQKTLRLDGNLGILVACLLYYFGFVSLGKDCYTASGTSTGFC